MGRTLSRSPVGRRLLLAEIARAASDRRPLPTNTVLAERFGLGSGSAVSALLNALEVDGIVRVFRGASTRVIEMVETGERTGGDIPALAHWRERAEAADEHIRIFRVRRNQERERERRARRHAEAVTLADLPPALPADRTPCPRCGIRADIGCRHLLGAPGTAVAGDAVFA